MNHEHRKFLCVHYQWTTWRSQQKIDKLLSYSIFLGKKPHLNYFGRSGAHNKLAKEDNNLDDLFKPKPNAVTLPPKTHCQQPFDETNKVTEQRGKSRNGKEIPKITKTLVEVKMRVNNRCRDTMLWSSIGPLWLKMRFFSVFEHWHQGFTHLKPSS